MSTNKNSSVLAIGIDAAESTLVRRMIEQKELPVLASLLAEGKWLEVRSPSLIGSGCVWPTFLTGEEPAVHGIYSEWKWLPETMRLRRYQGHHLTPFWKSLAQQGVSIGVLDVPFAAPVGITRGFEVCEWWAHDSTAAGLRAGPDAIRSLVEQSPPHPLASNRFFTVTPESKNKVEELAGACCEGARMRGSLARRLIEETNPQLSVVVFPEVHHAGHQLWHTVASKHPIYHEQEHNGTSFEGLLKNVYRAIDEQIGELITSGAETVMVFSLHGMRPALGFPAFLGPVLCERGFSTRNVALTKLDHTRSVGLRSDQKKRATAAEETLLLPGAISSYLQARAPDDVARLRLAIHSRIFFANGSVWMDSS